MSNQIKFFADADRQTLRVAVLFFVFLIVFETNFLETNFVDYFLLLGRQGDALHALICSVYIAVSIFCVFSFVLLAFASDWKYKIFYFLFFTKTIISCLT